MTKAEQITMNINNAVVRPGDVRIVTTKNAVLSLIRGVIARTRQAPSEIWEEEEV